MKTGVEKQSLESLNLYLKEAIEEVQMRIKTLRMKYSVSYETVRNYLEVNEPILIESLDILQKECDRDILGKAEEGKASNEEYTNWIRSVRDWKHLLLEGINRFENYQFVADVA